jgi:hypothetical protein
MRIDIVIKELQKLKKLGETDIVLTMWDRHSLEEFGDELIHPKVWNKAVMEFEAFSYDTEEQTCYLLDLVAENS